MNKAGMKTICFVTRCHPARPNMLKKCIESVKVQSCDDYEHFLLWDDKTENGYGVDTANKSLQKASLLNGQYIMVLDDDDCLISGSFVADFKEFVEKKQPDVVFFRGVVGDFRILPPDTHWGKRPVRGGIGSFCCAVRKEVWDKYIKFWVSSSGQQRMGDYTFINKCYNSVKTLSWMDTVVAATQRISGGRGEPKPKGESDGCSKGQTDPIGDQEDLGSSGDKILAG